MRAGVADSTVNTPRPRAKRVLPGASVLVTWSCRTSIGTPSRAKLFHEEPEAGKLHLFEVVRDDVAERVRDDLKRGAVFYDLQAKAPGRLDAFGASVKDGRGNTVSRRLFMVQVETSELALAPIGTPVPSDSGMPNRSGVEQALVEKGLNPFLEEVAAQRAREVETIAQHLEINMSLAELANRRIEGENVPGLEGNIAQAEAHLDELNNRLEGRRAELAMERHLAIGDIEHLGCAWVLPHPQRTSPGFVPMVRDEEIERIAVQEPQGRRGCRASRPMDNGRHEDSKGQRQCGCSKTIIVGIRSRPLHWTKTSPWK
jgi:hypothetical protein